MLSERWFSSLAVAAVILITAGYLVSTEPEELTVTSEDGVATVTGLARQTQPLAVSLGDAVKTPLMGAAYHVTPNGVTLDEPVVLSFQVAGPERDVVSSLGVYWFHPSLEMWEPVNPVVAHTNDVIAVETGQLGKFAVGNVPNFEAPVFANVYDELRAEAPPEAVGYEVAVGFTQPGHEVMRLLSSGENGGCNGAVRVGDGESRSRLERQATVAVDGQQQTLTFVFVTRWFTSSTGGCSADEPLRPLDEYDILDEIQI